MSEGFGHHKSLIVLVFPDVRRRDVIENVLVAAV
jgi:hypothetical protein